MLMQPEHPLLVGVKTRDIEMYAEWIGREVLQ
jgi:hypothetical protein